MKRVILYLVILLSKEMYSQTGWRYAGSDGIPRNFEFTDLSGKPMQIGDHSNIEGSPLLWDKWGFGIIKLDDGRVFADSSLNYSLFDDKLFFLRNGKTYPINYPVNQFVLENQDPASERKRCYFENKFPNINRNDSSTYYEILYSGANIKLLKWAHKKVRDLFIYGVGFQREYYLDEEYFALFTKENRMVGLGNRANSNSIRRHLPQYDDQVAAYRSAYGLGSKESDMIRLFSFLDEKH